MQFYAVKGRITINKQPCNTCTVSTYPLTYLTYADKDGRFVWTVPKDTLVMLVVLLNPHTKVGYLIKVNPRKRFLNIKLDSVANIQLSQNQKEWDKNEPYNSKHMEALYSSDEYFRFMKMWNCAEPILN